MSSSNKNHYQQYLKQLQSKVQTADDLISGVIKEATRKEIINKKRIVAGENNEVYEITLSNKNQVFLRISQRGEPDFKQEKWAIEQARKVGIPVPEIILIKHLTVKRKLLSFCIQEKIEGEVLDRGNINFDKFDKGIQRKIINQAGEILSKIHSIKTEGFGEINGTGKGKHPTYKDLMLQNVNQEKAYLKMTEKIGMEKKIMEKILCVIRDRASKLPNIQPILNHGDYATKHFVAKGEKITGILDWEEVNGNSPVSELANWDYWFGNEIPTNWLVEGYGNKSALRNWEEEIKWFRLNKGLEVLWWYVEENYQEAIDIAKKKLIQDLKYFG